MHIAHGLLHGAICPVTATLAAAGLGVAAVAATRTADRPGAARFAAVTAAVFAAQMLNVQVDGGTSGHLIGGVAAAALLGTPFAVLSLGLVLGVQALAFADGGLDALGANVLTMALVGAGLGGWLRTRLGGGLAATGAAAGASALAAAGLCAVLIALGGAVEAGRALPAMLAAHLPIALGEALLTVGLVAALRGDRAAWLAPACAALGAVALAPLASALPDGLEATLAALAVGEPAAAVAAPFAEYRIAGADAWWSTIAAGLVGVALVAAAAFGLGRALPARQAPAAG